MSLYAIGDLHLHFQSPLKAEGQLRGRVWKNHEEKFRKNCAGLLTEEDTLVLLGDHSWGRNLSECREDLRYIRELPGRKILLRGNHDMFWEAAKTQQLNEQFAGQLHFLQNNYYSYGDYALVGTKGYCFEGPFYLNARGRIIGWDEKKEAHAKKLVERELQRLRCSFEAARADGYRKYIVFLHYPPTSILLPPWRRSMAPSSCSTPTVTARPASTTVSRERKTTCCTAWCPAITGSGSH